ncbi:dimethylsulfonioproprionate lyase family protein [Aureimonas psammosilenae]|uniref:dimethylsulfonioproprionate lyase family protein n=1 Tax=Aureimonas psammosilenae TaxID=2495496 RepID=UPI001260BAE4|nr:dimethylsulfonioproprionate lyase family protein [Aureimonas psammosilenae]
MTERSPEMAEFIESLAEAFAAAEVDPQSKAALARIFAALETPAPAGDRAPQRLPVCTHLGEALSIAREASPSMKTLADAFAAVEPSMNWMRRSSGGPHSSENWPDGHANATILGPAGVENRKDLSIGVSLLAPNVRYPDHHHGPEEVYLLLSPGRFQHGESGWFEPGTGGTLYNEPHIRHAMASDEAPLLAIWCLWMDKAAA